MVYENSSDMKTIHTPDMLANATEKEMQQNGEHTRKVILTLMNGNI